MASRTSSLTVELIDDVSKPARSVEAALKEAQARIQEISAQMGEGAGVSDKFVSSLSRLKLGAADIDAVKAAWTDYTRVAGIAGAETETLTREQIAGVRGWESATLTSLRSVIRERSMETAAMRAAAIEQRGILTKQVEEQKALKRDLVSGAAGGIGGMLLGSGALTGIKDMAKEGAKLDAQLTRLKGTAKGPGEYDFAVGLAGDVSKKFPNITKADALDIYTETRSLAIGKDNLVDQARARNNVMIAAGTKTAIEGNDLGTFTAVDAQNLQKALEGSGRALEPGAFDKLTDAYVKAKRIYGSGIDSEKVLTAVMNAKAKNFAMGDEEFYGSMFARISEGNAARFGNEENMTLQTLVGGHAMKATGDWMLQHGLVSGYTKNGNNVVLQGLKQSELLQTNTEEWANQVLLPAMHKDITNSRVDARAALLRADMLKQNPNQTIDEDALRHRATEAEVSGELYKMGVRGTVSDNFIHWIGNELLIRRDTAQMGKVDGRDASAALAKTNPAFALKELTESISNFAGVLAGPALAKVAPYLDALGHKIADFADYISKANQNVVAVVGGLGMIGGAAGGGALLWKAFGGGFGLKSSAVALDGSAAALTRAAVALGGGQVSAGGAAAASVGGIARASIGAAAAVTGAVLAGSEAGNKEVLSDPEIIKRLADDDARKQANIDRDGWLKGSWENMFGNGAEIKRPTNSGPHPASGPVGLPPTMSVGADTQSLDEAFGKINKVHDAAAEPARMRIGVDTGPIEDAYEKVLQLHRAMDGLKNTMRGVGGMTPSLGSSQRGNFSFGGITGE